MADAFPGLGNKYVVDFATADGTRHFKVHLHFSSEISLTYTAVHADGSLSENSSTVDITVEPIRDMLFLVTWKEAFGTTVVHLEDYKNNRIITNITSPTDDPKKPSFINLSGPMTQVA